MKAIVYKNNEGGVSIVVPSNPMFNPESRDRQDLHEKGILPLDASDEAIYNFIINKDVPKDIEYKLVEIEDLPKDRYFRNAWTMDLEVDMDKARDMHMRSLRAIRDKKLKELDIPNMTAISRGDLKRAAAIDQVKQVLRDLPKNIDLTLFKTPDELKAYIPEELS